ncbi:uncharacterized protein LOC135385089 [Ornithodoros turicata]|uniref:uncharacterized protein LOC135385089 n=1 Tax=Ornithodoros turicata TaxID=34597 RepID=UPI00313A04DA
MPTPPAAIPVPPPSEHAPGATTSVTPSSSVMPKLTQPPQNISAERVKLPPYRPEDPAVWFAHADALFGIQGITTQTTKYCHVVSALQPPEAAAVRDLLITPPQESPYDKLKAELIRRMSVSEQRKLQQLLTHVELGDGTPSKYLRRMQQLLGDRPTVVDDSMLRQLFLQWLPSNACMVLAAAGDISLDDLANLADRVQQMTPDPIAAAALPS